MIASYQQVVRIRYANDCSTLTHRFVHCSALSRIRAAISGAWMFDDSCVGIHSPHCRYVCCSLVRAVCELCMREAHGVSCCIVLARQSEAKRALDRPSHTSALTAYARGCTSCGWTVAWARRRSDAALVEAVLCSR